MKDKKQELELSFISEKTDFKHKIMDRALVDQVTEAAQRALKAEDVEMQ